MCSGEASSDTNTSCPQGSRAHSVPSAFKEEEQVRPRNLPCKLNAALRKDLSAFSLQTHNAAQESFFFLFRKPLGFVAAHEQIWLTLVTYSCFGYHQNNCRSMWWLGILLNAGVLELQKRLT